MINWIESQSVWAIVALGYGICLGMGVAAFLAARAIGRAAWADALMQVTPALLTPLGLVMGLVLIFLSSRVWTNVDRAHAFVAQEASSMRELIRSADYLPSDVQKPVHSAVDEYLRWVITEDWPAMMAGQALPRLRLPGLQDAQAALAAFDTAKSGQRLMQQVALAAIERVREARRGRVLLSQNLVGSGQWIMVLVLFGHTLLGIAAVHLRRWQAKAFALGLFSSAFAICFVLLLLYDRPFRSGGLTVEPIGLHELMSPAE